jgi:hypothetical protein
MHPECRVSLSIVEKLIQYYPISPGPVAVTFPGAFSCHQRPRAFGGSEPAIVSGDGAETPAISRFQTRRLDPR